MSFDSLGLSPDILRAPRGDVSVRAPCRIRGNVAGVLPERGEAGHPVRFVIGEEQGLGPRSTGGSAGFQPRAAKGAGPDAGGHRRT